MKPDKHTLLRYITGQSSAKERLMVYRWAKESADNEKEIIAYRRLYDSTLINAPIKKIKSYRFRIIRDIVISTCTIAAAVLFGIFLGNMSRTVQNSIGIDEICTPIGHVSELSLNDGTQVSLNSNSTLIFCKNDSIREVFLDGEAYFKVAKDSEHPFVVRTPNNSIKVLGTTFNICSYSNNKDYSVALFEGQVSVLDTLGKSICSLSKGEILTSKDGQIQKETLHNVNPDYWRNGIYNFDSMTYGEIFDMLEKYYDVEIQILDEKIKQYTCTCKFHQNDSIEHILSVLSGLNSFKFRTKIGLSKIIIIYK